MCLNLEGARPVSARPEAGAPWCHFLEVNFANLDCARPMDARSEFGAPGRSCVAVRESPALASMATHGRRLDTRRADGGVSPEAPTVLFIFFVNDLAEEDDETQSEALAHGSPR